VSIRHTLLVMVISTGFGAFIGMSDWPMALGSCPQTAPWPQACPGALDKLCSDLDGTSSGVCTAADQVEVWSNLFGCYSVGSNVQCLDGIAPYDNLTCYVTCDCEWDSMHLECNRSFSACQRSFRVVKIEAACPGS
jgi:hypothetical protein